MTGTNVDMTGTDVGQLHALFIGIIPAGLKNLQRQYRNGKQKDKLFLMGCPQFVVSKKKILLCLFVVTL